MEHGIHVSLVGSWVAVSDLMDLATSKLGNFIVCAVLSYCLEEGINHRVRVSFSALHNKAAVEEASVSEHFPHNGVTPIVWLQLREDSYAEIVVTGLQFLRNCHHLIERNTNKVCSELFKGDFESCFVILALAHSIADHTVSIANKEKDSSGINTVKSSHICNRVRVDEKEGELSGVEDLILSRGEESLWARRLVLSLSCNSLIIHIND